MSSDEDRPFRFAAHKAFLTYPRADAIPSKEALFHFLLSLGTAFRCVVGREEHADGGIHYHAVLEFRDKFQSRNKYIFDFEGCHPNIARPRSVKDVIAYTIKDGDYVNQGFAIGEIQSLVSLCRDAAAAQTTVANAVVAVVTLAGDRGLRSISMIERFLQLIMKEKTKYEPLRAYPDDFKRLDIDGIPYRWMDPVERFSIGIAFPAARGTRDEHSKSLWLYGPSRMGKTQLARSLGTHWYMMSQWNAERLDSTAQYGVMDDIPWESMKFNYKGMLGLQIDVTVTDKYRKKTVYDGGIPVIVLSNELPDFTPEERNWLDANVEFVYINEEVFGGDL